MSDTTPKLSELLAKALAGTGFAEELEGRELAASAFAALTLSVASRIARADGRIDERESRALGELLASFGLGSDEGAVSELLNDDRLSLLLAPDCLSEIAAVLGPSPATLVWAVGLEMAVADGELHPKEADLLSLLQTALEPSHDVVALLEAVRPGRERVPHAELERLHVLRPSAMLGCGMGAVHVAAEFLVHVMETPAELEEAPRWRSDETKAFAEHDRIRTELLDLYDGALAFRRFMAVGAAEALADARESLRRARFQITVLGEFSRGKSTLIDAVLGGPILPRAVVPCNSGVVRLRFAPRPEFIVRAGGVDREVSYREFCATLFSASVEDAIARAGFASAVVAEGIIAMPHPLLAHEVEVVDTPGLNESPQLEWLVDREASRSDAFLLVLSGVQPVTRLEVEVLERLAAAKHHVFVVCNGMDLIPERERSKVEARVRASVVPRVPGELHEIFFVAAEPVLSVQTGETASSSWVAPMNTLRESIERFLAEKRGGVLVRSHAGRLTQALEQIEAVISGVEERERTVSARAHDERLRDLRGEMTRIRQQLASLDSMKSRLTSQVERFVREMTVEAERIVEAVLQEIVMELPREAKRWRTDESFLMPWAVAKDFGEQAQRFIAAELDVRVARGLAPAVEQLAGKLVREIGQDAAALYSIAEGVEIGTNAQVAAEDPVHAGERLLRAALGVVLVGPAGLLAGAGNLAHVLGMAVAGFAAAFVIGFFGGGPISAAIGVAVSTIAVAVLGREGMKESVRDRLVEKLIKDLPNEWPRIRDELRANLKERGKDIRKAVHAEVNALMLAARANLAALESEFGAAGEVPASEIVDRLEKERVAANALRQRAMDLRG